MGTFDFRWAPNEVQSAHFQYKSTLMVVHQKTKNTQQKKKPTQCMSVAKTDTAKEKADTEDVGILIMGTRVGSFSCAFWWTANPNPNYLTTQTQIT